MLSIPPDGFDAAQDHILDFLAVEAAAFRQRLEHGLGHAKRWCVGEGAVLLSSFAARGAHRIVDEAIRHLVSFRVFRARGFGRVRPGRAGRN
jgi:hypothetical protein